MQSNSKLTHLEHIVTTCASIIRSRDQQRKLFIKSHLFKIWYIAAECNRLIPLYIIIIIIIIISNLSKTGPKPLPKRFLHIVRSRAYSFSWQYPLLSLRSSSSYLRLLPRLLVTSICPFIFPSITCCRRQFLCKMWPIQLAFRFLISCRIFLSSLIRSNTSSFLTRSVQLIFSILLQHHISELSRCFWSVARSVQVSAPYRAMLQT